MLQWLGRMLGRPVGVERLPIDTSGGVYSGMRGKILSLRREPMGIPSPSADAPIWGALMDMRLMGMRRGSATLVALADGTTSLYTSTGGGVIGGHAHERVRRANAQFLDVANQLRNALEPTVATPIPAPGHNTFYALTDFGLLTGGGSSEELDQGRHPLSRLFHAAHGVITELRLTSEAG
jgi:hypothetical protein